MSNPSSATSSEQAIGFVQFKVEAEDRDRFLAAAREVMEATRSELGCVVYRYGADILDPNIFYITEIWESVEALDAHTRTAHYAKAMSVIPQAARIGPIMMWTGALTSVPVEI